MDNKKLFEIFKISRNKVCILCRCDGPDIVGNFIPNEALLNAMKVPSDQIALVAYGVCGKCSAKKDLANLVEKTLVPFLTSQ